MQDVIVGRNAVREALRSNRSFNKVLVQEGMAAAWVKSSAWRKPGKSRWKR